MNDFQQLSLGIKLDNQATFDNFYAPNGTPQHLAKMLLQDEGKQYAYICGSSGTGLSHLLQALCQTHSLRPASGAAIYLPLKELCDYPAEQVLQGLESSDISVSTIWKRWLGVRNGRSRYLISLISAMSLARV